VGEFLDAGGCARIKLYNLIPEEIDIIKNFNKGKQMDSEDTLVAFQGKQIRRTWHDNQRHFSVVDVISVLPDSPTPRQYRGNVKTKHPNGLSCPWVRVQLKLQSPDGK